MTSINDLLAGTGVQTTQDTTQELLAKFGLNWTVSKQPLNLPSGKPSGFFGIVRDDKEITFATAKDGYEVFQNSELLDLVNTSAGKLGLSLQRGGMFKNGGLVYLQIHSGNALHIGKNNDTIEKYIAGINSHDGSTQLRWGSSNVTISCQNTFWRAYASLNNRVKHTRSMRLRVEDTVKEMLGVIEAEKTLYETFYRFAEVGITQQNIVDVNKIVLNIDINGGSEDLTTYQRNRVADLSHAILGQMAEKGQTLFGLFNGVTKYTTHLMAGGDVARQQSKAIGTGNRVDNLVYNQFAEIVK